MLLGYQSYRQIHKVHCENMQLTLSHNDPPTKPIVSCFSLTEIDGCGGHGANVGLEVLGERHIVEEYIGVSMLAVEDCLEVPHGLSHVMQVFVLQKDHERGIGPWSVVLRVILSFMCSSAS